MELLNKFFKNKKDEPPYSYDFILNLKEKDYPKYLKKIFKYNMGYDLNLKNPKTFNEKIQWLKLYDSIPLKTILTDKVLVRDWVKERIGEEYLKPVLQICSNFSEIDFEKLPNKFIIKCNHGCKWHYFIKDKEKFINTPELYNMVKQKFDCWIKETFFAWAGIEIQYKNITPQILIEPILLDNKNKYPIENEIYCFNGKPRIFQDIKYSVIPVACVYNENFEILPLRFTKKYSRELKPASKTIKEAAELSKLLCKDFKLVRIDWLIYNNHLFFNEMTFTPFSGFNQFPREEAALYLGKMLELKEG